MTCMRCPDTPLPRRKLPIGVQTFAILREEGCYYVDKTPHILRLIAEGKYYFLSRPRRFGKSLLIDTIAELFEGNAALFTGLHAEQHWDWSARSPVVRISFGAGVPHSRADLDTRILSLLQENYDRHGLAQPESKDVSGLFNHLLQQLHAQTSQRVVVLVDEYDKPVLDNITDADTARQMRDGLRNLYSVLKDADAHIRFAMLTGVSKFSKVSLLSGLNNFKDITLDSTYSDLCGYTDADLDTVFAPELAGLNREDIRRWYHGYHWTGESVYNPQSILLHLSNPAARASWFETGTPSFLIELVRQRGHWTPPLGQIEIPMADEMDDDIGALPLPVLLFETGYLTIDAQTPASHANAHRLRYANQNALGSLVGYFLNRLLPSAGDFYRASLGLLTPLQASEPQNLRSPIERVFSGLCVQWCRSKPMEPLDGYWNSLFHAMFANLGLDCHVEDAAKEGRIDMTVLFNGHIYLFEFKVVELVPEGRALAQIVERAYADKYRSRGEPIHLIGVEFSQQTRSVVGFEVQSL